MHQHLIHIYSTKFSRGNKLLLLGGMIYVASCSSQSYLVFFLTKEKHETEVIIEEENKNQN